MVTMTRDGVMKIYEVRWKEITKRGKDEGTWRTLIAASDIKVAHKKGLARAIKTKFQKSNRVEILNVDLESDVSGDIFKVDDA